MPIPVDHDQRRRDIADATWLVIEEAGVQGVTMRRVAEKMNGSTTLVTHYFKDRDSLISFANERTFDRWRAELDEVAIGVVEGHPRRRHRRFSSPARDQ